MRPSRLPMGSMPRQISSPAEKSTSRSPGRSGWMRAGRTAGARVARDQIAQRILDRLEQFARQSRRRRDAERISHPRRVLGGDPALLAGDLQRKSAALIEKARERRLVFETGADLLLRKI